MHTPGRTPLGMACTGPGSRLGATDRGILVSYYGLEGGIWALVGMFYDLVFDLHSMGWSTP